MGTKTSAVSIYSTLSNRPKHKRIFKKQCAYPDLACPGGGIFDFTHSQWPSSFTLPEKLR
jgi:hypothetical protein